MFTVGIAAVLVSTGDVGNLADTTVLLLLCVFAMVNVCVIVLRRERVEHSHFRASQILDARPGARSCAWSWPPP